MRLKYFSDLSLKSKFLILFIPVSLIFMALMTLGIGGQVGLLRYTVLRELAILQTRFQHQRVRADIQRFTDISRLVSGDTVLLDWEQQRHTDSIKSMSEELHYELRNILEVSPDVSVFYASVRDGAYYYVERGQHEHITTPLYYLNRESLEDAWFYESVNGIQDCQVNVNYDRELSASKVWINCPVRIGGRVIGLIGTGLPLNEFILKNFVDSNGQSEQILNFVTDGSGYIQAHPDASRIRMQSVDPSGGDKNVYALLGIDKDSEPLAGVLQELQRQPGQVRVISSGKDSSQLLSVTYDEILDWYFFSLVNIDAWINPARYYAIIIMVFSTIALLMILAILFANRMLIQPVRKLENSLEEFSTVRNLVPIPEDEEPGDEIMRLTRRYHLMMQKLDGYTRGLEQMVKERTMELEQLSISDPLTGVLNRRGYYDRAGAVIEQARREKRELFLAIIDIDWFKTVNDRFGHAVGDQVLTRFARLCSEQIRPYDLLARIGGEEFVILVSGVNQDRMLEIVERIRLRWAATRLQNPKGEVRCTMSAGITAYHPERGDIDQHMQIADAALYQAKSAGRNRTVFASENPPAAVTKD